MRLLLRTASMAVVFALLAGPFAPSNWILGAGLSLAAAATIGDLRPMSRARAWQILLLPWFLIGVLLRTAAGAAQLVWLLLIRRDWNAVDFVACQAPAETGSGRMLLALAETASPGSIVISAEDRMLMSSTKADRPEEQCREMHTWHRRFQRPMSE